MPTTWTSSAVPLIDARQHDAPTGLGSKRLGYLEYASAVLHNGLGRYDVAMRSGGAFQRAGASAVFLLGPFSVVEAAARTILSSSSPLLVPLGVSMHAAIRKSHLVRLRSGGTLAQLIARQAEAFDAEWHNAERYRSASSVPNDMINFLYDPVACAIGAGCRDRVSIETLPVVWEICEDQLVQQIDRGGKPLPAVTGLDGLALEAEWVRRVRGATRESVVA